MDAKDKHVDRIFDHGTAPFHGFQFDQRVVKVFDDMVHRSVPFYEEIQRMVAELAGDFVVPGTNVYDLGCSTGATLIPMSTLFGDKARLIGYDDSPDMLEKCRAKCAELKVNPLPELRQADFNQGFSLENASVVTLILTLQFVRPLNRESVMRSIYEGLNPNGCLLLVEKVLGEDSLFNTLFIQHYYEFKRRQGYSETEIARKREALENVLVPYKMMENFDLLKRTGFRSWDVFFRWYNFMGIVAMK